MAWGPRLVENTPWGITRINLAGVDRTGRGVKVGVLTRALIQSPRHRPNVRAEWT